MTENLIELYYEKLYKDNNPGLVLTKFYCELFTLAFSPQKIITFNKLLKLYSRSTVFFSIVDCYDVKDITHDKIYGLLSYFCKKRMENKLNGVSELPFDLTNSVKEINRKIDKLTEGKELKINDPFDE